MRPDQLPILGQPLQIPADGHVADAELPRHAIAQLPDPDRERATARFARLCDLAKPLNIFVSLEFPHWTETGNIAEAARVVRSVNRANAGILVDMLHFGRSDSSLDELAKLRSTYDDGVLVQDNFALLGETKFIGRPSYRPHGPAPIMLQARGDPSEPVSFRNVWLRELD